MQSIDQAGYLKLLDAQTLSFIEQTNRWYPPETIDFTLERQREIYDAMCREFHNGYPAGISASDSTITTSEYNIPVRRYSLKDAETNNTFIAYLHGGGFVVGGLDSHDDVCAELCASTGHCVTAIDYRLAPEHLHPAAFKDALAAVTYECRHTGQSAVLCGDSAGGNLAAAVSHTLRGNSKVHIKGQVLIYPGLGGDITTGSYVTHANAPMLTKREVDFYSKIRTNNKKIENIVSFAPLQDTDFSNLPDTVVFSAECDPLADDGKHYCDAIVAANGNAKLYIEKGLVHGYLRARHSVNLARASFDRIVSSIIELA